MTESTFSGLVLFFLSLDDSAFLRIGIEDEVAPREFLLAFVPRSYFSPYLGDPGGCADGVAGRIRKSLCAREERMNFQVKRSEIAIVLGTEG